MNQPNQADPLSALAPLLRVRQIEIQEMCLFGSSWASPHLALPPPWAQFHIVTKGSCRLALQDGQQLQLQAGTLLLLPRGDAHTVRSLHAGIDPDKVIRVEDDRVIRLKFNTRGPSEVELICGRLQFDAASSVSLIAALPAAILVDVHSQQSLAHMRTLLQMVDQELKSAHAGALAVAADLSSALFVLMLRLHFEHETASIGLVRLLRSSVCAKAVNAMLNRPTQHWNLDGLARNSHVSRATLVRAFQKAAGMAPLAFLTEVRLNLARQALVSSSSSLASIAANAGYTSASAFVRAFTRRFGTSPGKLRAK